MTSEEDSILALCLFAGLIIAYFIVKVFDKKINTKIKELLAKVFVSIGFIIVFLSVILGCYFKARYDYAAIEDNLFVSLSFVTGMLIGAFGSFIAMFGTFKNSKPKKYSLKQSNYEEFSGYLEVRVKEYNYELYDSNGVANFYRREIKRNIYFVIDVKVDELTEESFEELYNEKIFPIIDEDFIKMQDKRYSLYITMIISVDRITPMFYKYIDSGNIDRLFYKYPVGISFGSNQIYITGDEAFGFNTNKKVVKEVKEILEIEEIKKDSD